MSKDVMDGLKAERDALAAQAEALECRLDLLDSLVSDTMFDNNRLTRERNALVAQIEAMREMANRANKHLTKGYGPQVFNALYCNLALSALAELDAFTPQQCLRDVQAEAGRKGYLEGVLNYDPDYDPEWLASQYAATVRKGGAE